MAVNDIYEVTHVQELYNQQVLNVYFYEQRGAFVPSTGTTAQALADEWVETVFPAIDAFITGDMLHVECRVRNLFDATDQGVTIIGTGGSSATDTSAGFVAASLRLNTDNAAIRPGAKRYGGVADSEVVDGVLASTGVTLMNAVAAAVEAPITGGLIIEDDIMFPVVVQRIREGTPGNYTYRLPETTGEAVVGLIIEAFVNVLLTSQVSRKIGSGL